MRCFTWISSRETTIFKVDTSVSSMSPRRTIPSDYIPPSLNHSTILFQVLNPQLSFSFSNYCVWSFFFFFFFFVDCMCEWIWLILLFIKKAWFRFLEKFLLQTKPILCKEQKVSDAKVIFVFYTEIEYFNSFELSLPREIFFIRWLKSQKLCNLFLVVLYLLVLKWNKSVSFEILGPPFQYCLFWIQFLGR